MINFPKYEDLPTLGSSSERHAWDVFGRHDQLGCMNRITSEKVRSAVKLVQAGVVVNLDLPIDQPSRQFWTKRTRPEHVELVRNRGRDDYLNSFYLQGSSQWDWLRHYRFREYGYFGERTDEDLEDRGDLGISGFADQGMFTRGLLIDVAGYMADSGTPIDFSTRFEIRPELLESILREHGLTPQVGDMLLVHTGWLEWYLGLDDHVIDRMASDLAVNFASFQFPGLHSGAETARWLWDQGFASVAVDNPSVEPFPERAVDPEAAPADIDDGWLPLHHRMIPLLGMPFGELWNLAHLASECRRQGRYEFFVTASPMNLPRGAGSPANAYALF